jgi:streptothricin hydrolase
MTTALMMVDAQRNMLEGESPVPGAGEIRLALQDLLSAAREAGAVIVHVQNDGPAGDPDEPYTAGWELVLPVAGDELVVRKDQPDTFGANPALAQTLRDRGVDRIVIAGLQSEYCVQATGQGALGLGFRVVLPRGAHATYDGGSSTAADTSAAVERDLREAGVQVVPLSQVSF